MNEEVSSTSPEPGSPATPMGTLPEVPAPTLSAIQIADILGRPRPTPEQIDVIEAPLAPMIVVAGAGSGKTETMAGRVVWLIANGWVQPDQVLGLTFTRKAAGELSERIDRRLRELRRARGVIDTSLDALDRPTVSTYNSYAGTIVTDHGLRLGIEPGAQLLTEAGTWQLASTVVETWAEDLDTPLTVGTITSAVLSLENAMNEHLVSPAEVVERITADLLQLDVVPLAKGKRSVPEDARKLISSLALRRRLVALVEELRALKRERGLLAFGDQIALAARLAMDMPAVAQGERQRYATVLLDEYQDTSHAQTTLLRALFGSGHPVTAVGDPNQSIYAWRGASASSLSRFVTEFPQQSGAGALTRQLSTSWRNDQAILEVANLTAQPLRDSILTVEVAPLVARPGAGDGNVLAHWAQSAQDEAEYIADYIASRWQPGSAPGGVVSAAVLCRARKQFPRIAQALEARSIPVEIVGLGGLLAVPEVCDVVAFLEVVHDPSRGDSLMRLLMGPWLNIGAADLHGLSAWAKALDRQDQQRSLRTAAQSTAADSPAQTVGPTGEPIHDRSIVDALDDIGVALDRGQVVAGITESGQSRMQRLAAVLREVRGLTYLPVPEVVARAEQALNLDIEVALIRPGRAARAHIDALRAVASSYASTASPATLGGFLAWLDAAQSQERGLDRPVAEPDPDAVQLITVHGAKGLEWDVVAVPGLADGAFPATVSVAKPAKDKAWLHSASALPYPLRGDWRDLPVLDLTAIGDSVDLANAIERFTEQAGQQSVQEERRLAYVAFTRARNELLLSGAWWRDGVRQPATQSVFYSEIVESGQVRISPDSVPVEDVMSLNPLQDDRVGWWPQDSPTVAAAVVPIESANTAGPLASEDAGDVLAASAREVAHQIALSRTEDPSSITQRHLEEPAEVRQLRDLGRLLLAERDEVHRGDLATVMPTHLSASTLVRLAQDRAAVERDWRRPVPREPSAAAQRGTAIHAWIEQYYGRPSLLDVDDMDMFAADDQDWGGPPSGVADIAQLRTAFEESVWAGREPVAIEEAIDTMIAGVVTRTKIDAVFRDPAVPGGVVVIDWKSGRVPRAAEEVRAREVQLAVYRLAWARASGMPLNLVSAAFHYVADNLTVWPDSLLDAEGLEALIAGETD